MFQSSGRWTWVVRTAGALLMLASVVQGLSPAGAEAAPRIRVTPRATVIGTRAAALRSAPQQRGEQILARLKPGTRVTLLAGPDARGWYAVRPADDPEAPEGWLPERRLRFDTFARAMTNLRLRERPGKQSDALGRVRRGMVVAVVGPLAGVDVLVRLGDDAGYVDARKLAPAKGPATDPHGERWVDVDRGDRTVRLMIGNTAVETFRVSVSRDQGEGFYATAVGSYRIYEKVAELQWTPYAQAYFTFWAGFDPARFNGFHSWTMDAAGNVLPGGDGPTSGCVSLAPDDARTVYAFVRIGTRVEVHWVRGWGRGAANFERSAVSDQPSASAIGAP